METIFDELFDLIANNIIVISGWIIMCKWLGAAFFLTFYSLILTVSAAIFICIFFIQHNYEMHTQVIQKTGTLSKVLFLEVAI